MSTNTIPKVVAGETINLSQEQWLDGFFSGLKNKGVSFGDIQPEAGPTPKVKKTLEEKMKEELDPIDAYSEILKKGKNNTAPEKADIFRFKWNGLFWLAPVHEGYMCRLRIPGGEVSADQLRELSSITDDIAWGYLQITTRNNFQLRVIQPKDTPELLRRIQDCGLQSRGSGADNLRNFTANPTSGFDPYELIDVMPLIKDLAHYIENHREFYDLPRKFNISYDSGGLIGVAEDTNDIGLRAIKLKEPPAGHPLEGKVTSGVYFQIMLGGVTGHKEFAENCHAICRPEDATEVAASLTRVFIKNGNRGNRGKARMIYLIKEWGYEKYLEETAKLLDDELISFNFDDQSFTELIEEHKKPSVAHPQIGVQPQKDKGKSWLGVYVPVGILQSGEARAIAEVADEFGSGRVRLTIFQNLIIPDIPNDRIDAAQEKLAAAGLRCMASAIRGGVSACTGNRYCKFASSDTKGHSLEIVEHLESKLTLDQPINIHVTGCPHSCAQHYIGDIGLLACKVKKEGLEEPVEGYHVFVGGGFGLDNKRLGRQLFKSVAAGPELNEKIEALLRVYLANRYPDETFQDFTTRHEIENLEAMVLQLSGGVLA
ncbi:MAG: NirA family protein [Verrucomicrobiales bacterium]|nr:NirA family protein [Verrucomicrobiales bacterium]